MQTLTTLSPINSKPIITTRAATINEIKSSVLPAAMQSQKSWQATPLAERKAVVSKYLEILRTPDVSDRLCRGITEQMGRPIRYTKGELASAELRTQTLVDYADDALKKEVVDAANPKFRKYLTHEPLGVVLIIFPWNYPYLTLTNALIPALLGGNSVIIKPSPQTPQVANDVVDLFEQAGLPKGVLQAVHIGDPEVIAELIQQPEIAGVSFTGSVQGGLAVQKAASGRTIPVALELGGNDAAYVRADIKDFRATAEDIVDGALFNSGQSCCAIERVYVDRKIFRPFVDQVVEVVKQYVVGDPFDEETHLGPVISEKAARNIRAQIKDAVDRGAKTLIPEHYFGDAEKLNPTFVGPQVLVDLDETSLVVSTETFGPVIPILMVGSDEEAIRRINDSDLGLTASVWTADEEAGELIGYELEAGTVFVNRADYPDPHLAWTGYKNSGRGVTLSKYGFGFFTKLKSHHVKLAQ